MSTFNNSKSSKSTNKNNKKYFSSAIADETGHSLIKESEEKPLTSTASQSPLSQRMTSDLTSSSLNSLGDTSINEISNQANSLATDIGELPRTANIRHQEEINRVVNSSLSEDEYTSELYTFYNKSIDIKRLSQTKAVKTLYDSLSLDNSSNIENNNNISLLSHENYKITKLASSKFSYMGTTINSNGTFIHPDQLSILNSSYYNGKLSNISKRFFFNNKATDSFQEVYIDSVKTNSDKKRDYLNSFDELVKISNEFTASKNFANQVIDYASKGKNNNYFGKIINSIYKNDAIVTSNIDTHVNDDFLLINNVSNNTDTDNFLHENLEYVLENYYKLKFNEQVDEEESLSIVDSDAFVARLIGYCGLSLENIHDGSFTANDYKKETDLNFDLYDTLINNKTLKTISAISLVNDYNLLKANTNQTQINITSPYYTNTLRLPSIKKVANEIEFKADSIFYIKDYYLNDETNFYNFKKSYALQFKETTQKRFSPPYISSNINLVNESIPWMSDNDLKNIDLSAPDEGVELTAFTDARFKANFGLSKLDYMSYRNNLLEIDAFVHQSKKRISLIYFDADSVVRQADDSDSNNIKYLSAPTFSFYSSFYNESGYNLSALDDGFEASRINYDHNSKSRSLGFSDKDLFVQRFTTHQAVLFNFVKNDVLRYRPKLWNELDKSRVSYSYSPSNVTNSLEYEDSLRFFIDRNWSEIAIGESGPGKINTKFFSDIGFGAVMSRYGRTSGKLTASNAISDISKIPTIKSKVYLPFICVSNTNKSYDFNSDDIKTKFLDRSDSLLTSEEEKFRDRVILSSTSRDYPNKVKNFVKDIKQKSTSGEGDNDWIHRSFRIKRHLFSLKQTLLKDSDFYGFLRSHSKKCDNILKSKVDSNVFTFLHDDKLNTEKIYTLDESPFLIKKNDKFYTKNNFIETSNEKIDLLSKNLNIFSNEEIAGLSSFASIDDYKKFMIAYYPNSFLKNTSSFFRKINEDVASSLDTYTNTFFQGNKELIGFEKLLLNKVASDFDVFKMLVYIVLEKEINSKINNNLNYESLNKETNNLYKSYLTSIFSLDNIKKQETYTIRTISDYTLDNIKANDINGKSYNFNRAIKKAGFVCTTSGKIKSYLFPSSKHNSVLATRKFNFAMQQGGQFRLAGTYNGIAELIAINTYNYDSYLHVTKDEKNANSLFTGMLGEDLNVKINYIVLHEDIPGAMTNPNAAMNTADINLYDEETINYLARSFFMSLSGEDNGVSGDELYDRIPGNLFYQIKNTASYDKDLTLDLLDNDGTFTSKIIDYIKGFITYIYTDDEIDEIVSSDFINTNKKILEIMHNLVIEYVNSCLYAYENISKLSFYKNVHKEVKTAEESSERLWWDEEISRKFSKEYRSIGRLDSSVYNIKRYVRSDRAATSISDAAGVGNPLLSKEFYSFKEFLDIRNTSNLLDKSDYLEALSYDLIYGYLSNFDFNKNELVSNNEEQLSIQNSIKEASEVILEIENFDFSKVISNKMKLCKISKNMQSSHVYDSLKVRNINRLMTSRLRNLDFKDYNIFDNKIKLEENKRSLANIGMKYFMSGDYLATESFMKTDVLRFGIPYDLANSLSDDKILKITVYPVNHKYPEIEFFPYEFLYTPIITSLTPATVDFINGEELDTYLGQYNKDAADFREKYSFVKESSAGVEMARLLNKIESRRTVFGFNTSPATSVANIKRIITAAKFSNSIKYLNDSFNSVFDESKINRLNIDFDNIITGEASEILNSFDPNEFLKIFSESYEDALKYVNEETGYLDIINKSEIIDNNIHSLEFFKNISKDISMIDFLKPLTTDAYFDIFSVRITRDSLIKKIKNTSEFNNMSSRVRQGFSNSYTYVITTEIYWLRKLWIIF